MRIDAVENTLVETFWRRSSRLHTVLVAFVVAANVIMGPAALALTPAQWREDIAVLNQAVTADHPNFFEHQQRADFDGALRALDRDLPDLSDQSVVVRLMEIVAAGRDGHTRLMAPVAAPSGLFTTHTETRPPNTPLFGQIPLRLRRTADGYIVIRSSPEHRALLGAQLVAIADLPVEDVEERLLPIVHGTNIHQQRNLLASFMVIPEILVERGVAASTTARWDFQLSNGAQLRVLMQRAPSTEQISWLALDAASESEPFAFSRLPDGAMYLRVAEVVDSSPGSFAAFVDDLEAAFSDAPPRALLIDLRQNIGGDNSLISPLVRLVVRQRELWSPGGLFVATDGGTFSAAVTLSAALERWTPAIFVGTPTGGAPNDYGDPARVILPASGLTLRVSSLHWQSGDPRDPRDAIAPLIAASATTAQARGGVDPVLAAFSAWTTDAAASVRGDWQGKIAIEGQLADVDLYFGDRPSIEVEGTDTPAAPLHGVTVEDGELRATATIAGFPSVVRARRVEAGWIGQLELRGGVYPFVLTSDERGD